MQLVKKTNWYFATTVHTHSAHATVQLNSVAKCNHSADAAHATMSTCYNVQMLQCATQSGGEGKVDQLGAGGEAAPCTLAGFSFHFALRLF